jgi:hypothetical protein
MPTDEDYGAYYLLGMLLANQSFLGFVSGQQGRNNDP